MKNKYEEKMKQLGAYYVRDGDPGRLDPSEIKSIEHQIGFRLPDDYAHFLADYGGYAFESYVEFPYLQSYPGGERGMFNVFFGIMPGSSYDLTGNLRTYQGRISSDLLPIGNDPGGNIICLSIVGDDRGAVYFWDHEEEASEGSNAYLIARSFDEFINSLESVEEE